MTSSLTPLSSVRSYAADPSRGDRSSSTRLHPMARLILLSISTTIVVSAIQLMRRSTLPASVQAIVLVIVLAAVAYVGASVIGGQRRKAAAKRQVEDLLRFFDDVALLRARADGARALLADRPANESERRAINAIAQTLGMLAVAVQTAPPEGRSAVFAHPHVGAWLRALAVTSLTLPLDAAQRSALAPLQRDLGAAKDRREGLDPGSRALLERDAVLFRPEDNAARIF